MTDKDQTPCRGCHDDFYNGRQNFTGNECWNLKTAKLVKRFRIGKWTVPTEPGAFEETRVYNCRSEKGFAFYDKLPDFAVDVRRKTP